MRDFPLCWAEECPVFLLFDAVAVQRIDYVMMLVYMFCGCVLAYFYETTHTVTGIIAGKIPGVVKEILAGLCLGVIGMLIPAVMFSGEEQMGVLMKEYAGYMAIALIGAAFLKIISDKSLYPVWIKRRAFFPGYFCRSMSGIRTCDAVLRTAGGQSCCICGGDCNIDTSRRYHEEAVGGDHAFVPVFSGEDVYMDIYCSSSGK